jgi:hypothetical protein
MNEHEKKYAGWSLDKLIADYRKDSLADDEHPECVTGAFHREIIRRLTKLDWYERRERYVRALAGACEDGYANHENGEPGEAWRALVDFELNKRSE